MITLVEPQQHIARLWGKPVPKEGEPYRLMRYVLRADHESKILLHNAVTGQLVVLEEEEAETLNRLPVKYCPIMEQLSNSHFLIPANFDEHAQVVNMRKVLRMLMKAQQKPGINHFTILPTTACNARCYYCYQQGLKQITMSNETLRKVTDFIDSHCGEDRKIHISWFGGEPTVAARQISLICEGLRRKNIAFQSSMTTNGYLFDEEMTAAAEDLWQLKRIMISVDGTEKNYNTIKRFQNAKDNPYQRVMGNVERFLNHGIRVNMRMNFDLNNYLDFFDLLNEVTERFHDYPLFSFRVHQVNGEHSDPSGKKMHGSNDWFQSRLLEFQSSVYEKGLLPSNDKLPSLDFMGCQAGNDHSVTINPQGGISKCPEMINDEHLIGNVTEGIKDSELISSWSNPCAFDDCIECSLFPDCMKLDLCPASHRCVTKKESLHRYQNVMIKHFRNHSNSVHEGDEKLCI